METVPGRRLDAWTAWSCYLPSGPAVFWDSLRCGLQEVPSQEAPFEDVSVVVAHEQVFMIRDTEHLQLLCATFWQVLP
jgi:hypothetical protein